MERGCGCWVFHVGAGICPALDISCASNNHLRDATYVGMSLLDVILARSSVIL